MTGSTKVPGAVSGQRLNGAKHIAFAHVRSWAWPALAWYFGVRPMMTAAHAQLLADNDPAHAATCSPRPVIGEQPWWSLRCLPTWDPRVAVASTGRRSLIASTQTGLETMTRLIPVTGTGGLAAGHAVAPPGTSARTHRRRWP